MFNTMKQRDPRSPAMEAASKMPELTHWLGHDQSFSIAQSEVVKWLIKQPECQQFLFNCMKNAGVIEFDLESRRWRGVNWQPKESAPGCPGRPKERPQPPRARQPKLQPNNLDCQSSS
jgi:hypothetical protein